MAAMVAAAATATDAITIEILFMENPPEYQEMNKADIPHLSSWV